MPSKKRKAAATATTRGKRVRIGSSYVIGEDDASPVSPSGRPKRSTTGDPSYDQTRRRSSITVEPDSKGKTAVISQSPKRGPGRPRKSTVPTPASTSSTQKAIKKTVGQPPKTATHVELPVRKIGRSPKNSSESRGSSPATKSPATTLPTKPIAKPSGKRGQLTRAALVQELIDDSTGAVVQEAEWDDGAPENGPDFDDERQFWLMKAEPESRIEKGHDVKFSIDDLMGRTEPEGWDGVRNFVARNNMRAMREGDLAFFYHSNCAAPGIAGVMQIVQEHSIDESAFDPDHPYFDPKSTDRNKPKWELVHVKGMHKFANLVTLKELKTHMGPGQALENLQTLKQSRLSVSSVSPKEWNFIMDLTGEVFEEDKN